MMWHFFIYNVILRN